MSIQQKLLQSQGLTDYETHIVDSLPTSKYFKVFSLEDTIPGGRSTFQILGSEFLEDNVELKISVSNNRNRCRNFNNIRFIN